MPRGGTGRGASALYPLCVGWSARTCAATIRTRRARANSRRRPQRSQRTSRPRGSSGGVSHGGDSASRLPGGPGICGTVFEKLDPALYHLDLAAQVCGLALYCEGEKEQTGPPTRALAFSLIGNAGCRGRHPLYELRILRNGTQLSPSDIKYNLTSQQAPKNTAPY